MFIVQGPFTPRLRCVLGSFWKGSNHGTVMVEHDSTFLSPSMVDEEADRIQREEELSEWQEFRQTADGNFCEDSVAWSTGRLS